MSSTATKNRYL